MMDYYHAFDQLLSKAFIQSQKQNIQDTALPQCTHRYLAQDIPAKYPSPLFSNSAMDGYALCFDPAQPLQTFKITGRVTAGESVDQYALTHGQAVRIFTGAPVPTNCTAVVAQEDTQIVDGQLHCASEIRAGKNVRKQAEEFASGEVLLRKGSLLTPSCLGLAASQGYATLSVFTPPTITVFSTGNELLEPGQPLKQGHIYDANRYQLIGWLDQMGCRIVDGGILPDDLPLTMEKLEQAAQSSDLVITSGGASVGEADHLKQAIQQIGELTHWKLAIKPGKPFAWGTVLNTAVMMLPGNPVATFVNFKMLVEPLLRVRMGASIDAAKPRGYLARANFPVRTAKTRREFLRGVYSCDAHGTLRVDALPHQGSHMMSGCVTANCLIEIAPDKTFNNNDLLPIYPL